MFVLGVGALFSLVSGSESVGAARRRIVRAKALFGRGKVKAKLREDFLERHVSAENIAVALAKVRKLSKASAVPPLQIVLEVVERSLHENLTHAAFLERWWLSGSMRSTRRWV